MFLLFFALKIKFTCICVLVDWYSEIWVYIQYICMWCGVCMFFYVRKLWKSPGYTINGTMLLFFPTSINFLCTVRTFHRIINWTESNVYVNLISVWESWMCPKWMHVCVYVLCVHTHTTELEKQKQHTLNEEKMCKKRETANSKPRVNYSIRIWIERLVFVVLFLLLSNVWLNE